MNRYWRQVSENVYSDDYYEDVSIFSFQCLNCKVEWECDKSPEAFRLCPFCEVRWRGEFTSKNPRYSVPERKLPAFVVQHLKGRPYDNIKDVWHDYYSVPLLCTKNAQLIRRIISGNNYAYDSDNVKAIRILVRYPDGSVKILREYTGGKR